MPAVLVPSPQLIVAVKSLAVAFGLASVKVATGDGAGRDALGAGDGCTLLP